MRLISPLHSIFLFLAVSVAACSSIPEKGVPARTPEAPSQKKTDEPVVKKPEAVEKVQAPVAHKAEQELEKGIRKYEEGDYKNAAGDFQNALAGEPPFAVRLAAHKYLAFIYCVSGEKLACRGEFKKLLNLNPKFELAPAEAGHPIWGPVFREVRAEANGRKRSRK